MNHELCISPTVIHGCHTKLSLKSSVLAKIEHGLMALMVVSELTVQGSLIHYD